MMRDHRDDPDATTRADCCRLLAMVGELHARGYQRIRACPSLSGSGGYWRCSITAADNVTSSGVVIVDFEGEPARAPGQRREKSSPLRGSR